MPPLLSNFDSLPQHLRTLALKTLAILTPIALQLTLLSLAFWLALALRSNFSPTTNQNFLTTYFLPLLPLLLAIKLTVWLAMSLHRGTWRDTSLGDAVRLLAGSLISLGLIIAAYNLLQLALLWRTHAPAKIGGLPETLFILDSLFALLLIGGTRIAARLLYEESRPIATGGIVRLLIVGAGEAAAAVLREIARMPEQRYRVIGLLDDDSTKHRTRIQGARVLGPISTLPRICREQQIGEILIAMPSASNQEMQRIISLCRATQMEADVREGGSANSTNSAAIRFRTIPSLHDILTGKASATQIRDVGMNDILGRDAVDMDLGAVGAMLCGQRVLITGAGGSIGSELCRTICRFEPALVLLMDKAENAIFEIERELKKSFPAIKLVPIIGDISDPVRVDQVFSDYSPSIVFHAAAHKHVPLAESNPGEAIRNNVFGTKTLADAAAANGVKNFVMISTDKAVNPSSIMGATKRCAELYIQSLARREFRVSSFESPGKLETRNSKLNTNFVAVRFGNVLGSNGSVVPIFKQQIAAGGPVTVTHPEMRRYFMTIPEACQLVLQAGALGHRGEIFVLDMGKPVRILDLARDLIILSGLRPDVDIPIVFTGLRPGEKLYEELSAQGENMAATRHPKIAIWTPPAVSGQLSVASGQTQNSPTTDHRPLTTVQKMIDELEPLQHCTNRHQVLAALKAFVPEMKPWEAEATNTPTETPKPKNIKISD